MNKSCKTEKDQFSKSLFQTLLEYIFDEFKSALKH